MLELVRTSTERRYAPSDEPPAWDLDEPHRALWDAIRSLFPHHADVTQTDHGCLLVSWILRDVRRGSRQYAAPVMIRMEPGLLLALWTCSAEDRQLIAELQRDTVAHALEGYDPYSRIPTCGVIVLGDG